MEKAEKRMLDDARRETASFYDEGVPKRYERTGALGRTPRATGVKQSGNSMRYEVSLDQSHVYKSGMGMGCVLEHAEREYDRMGILGRPQFWERASSTFGQTVDESLGEHFERIG